MPLAPVPAPVPQIPVPEPEPEVEEKPMLVPTSLRVKRLQPLPPTSSAPKVKRARVDEGTNNNTTRNNNNNNNNNNTSENNAGDSYEDFMKDMKDLGAL
jgi:hypothetical protein